MSPADQTRMEVKEVVELSERGLFLLKPFYFGVPDLSLLTANLALDKETLKVLRRQIVSRQSFEDVADRANESNASLFNDRETVTTRIWYIVAVVQ